MKDDMKKCSRCFLIKRRMTEFSEAITNKDGRQCKCKECVNEISKINYRRRGERRSAVNGDYVASGGTYLNGLDEIYC